MSGSHPPTGRVAASLGSRHPMGPDAATCEEVEVGEPLWALHAAQSTATTSSTSRPARARCIVRRSLDAITSQSLPPVPGPGLRPSGWRPPAPRRTLAPRGAQDRPSRRTSFGEPVGTECQRVSGSPVPDIRSPCAVAPPRSRGPLDAMTPAHACTCCAEMERQAGGGTAIPLWFCGTRALPGHRRDITNHPDHGVHIAVLGGCTATPDLLSVPS